MKQYIKAIKQLPKSQKVLAVVIASSIFLLAGSYLYSQQKDTIEVVATVNNQEITRQDLQQTIEYRQRFFEVNKQVVDTQTIEQDSLNLLINETLLSQYVAANSLVIDEQELNQLYAARVQQFSSEAELLAEIEKLYGFDKEAYLTFLNNDLLREKIQANTNQPYVEWLEEQKQNSDIRLWL